MKARQNHPRVPTERHALIESAIPFARREANRKARVFGTRHSDDLFSAALEGLTIAAGLFDPARNVKYLSYAGWWVRNRIQEYCKSASRLPETQYPEFGGGGEDEDGFEGTIAECLDDTDGASEAREVVEWALADLCDTDRRREVVRVWLGCGCNGIVAARELGCSQVRVNQIVADFRRRIRADRQLQEAL